MLFLALCLLTSVQLASANEAARAMIIRLDILSVNDFHGALLEDSDNPGVSRLAGFLKKERAKAPERTLLLAAGDMFQGSIDSNLLYGKPVVAVMNDIGFDAMVLGNHEFDWGLDHLTNLAMQAHFPMLAANVINKRTGTPLGLTKPYIVVKRMGIKIAVIGIATPETAYKANPKLVKGYAFLDPAMVLKTLIPELRARGVDIIVVLSHLGSYIDKDKQEVLGEAAAVAAGVPGIDVLISGHSHQYVAGKVNGVPIVQAGLYGRAVGRVSLLYSPRKRQVLSSTAEVISLTQPVPAEDLYVRGLVKKSLAEVAPRKNIVLGQAAAALTHDRYQLSLLGQWVTDVMREAVQADVAFINGGALRTGIPAGKITLGRLYEVCPFDNTLYTLELSGAQIIKVLQYGLSSSDIGTVQFSGLIVKYNASLPQGMRVVEVTLADGTPLDENKYYKVVTNDFMAAGGDGYNVFKDGRKAQDSGRLLRAVLIEAIKQRQAVEHKGDNRLLKLDSVVRQAA